MVSWVPPAGTSVASAEDPDPEDLSRAVSSSYVKHVKHVPKHRAPAARRAPKAALKTSLTLSSMAVVATGFAVGAGSLSASGGPATSAASDVAVTGSGTGQLLSADADGGSSGEVETAPETSPPSRAPIVTRSDSRETPGATDPLKADALSLGQGNTMARTEDLTDEDPRVIAQALLSEWGWSADQFGDRKSVV